MALIAPATLQSYTDKLAIMFEQSALWFDNPGIGGTINAQSTPTAGKAFNLITNLESLIANIGDQEIEADLGPNVRTARLNTWIRWALTNYKTACSQLNDHCAARGNEVNASIVDLITYLNYYNGGLGGAKFSCLVHPSFVAMYNFLLQPLTFNVLGSMSPGIHPNLPTPGTGSNSTAMATKTVAGVLTIGASVNTTYYQGVNLVVETTTSFASGTAPPTITVTGTDDLGNAAQTWTGSFTQNNPAASLSTTVTGALTAQSSGSNVVASSAGFAVGQVAIIDNNLPTQESIIIEAIADGTHLTFSNRLAHNAGATITAVGQSIALTPTGAGRRCVSVSGVTIGITAHTAGTVRVCGVQDRMGKPN